MARDRSFPVRKLTRGEKLPKIPSVTIVAARGTTRPREPRTASIKTTPAGCPSLSTRPVRSCRCGALPPDHRSWLSRIVGASRAAAAAIGGAGISARRGARAAGVAAAAGARACRAGAGAARAAPAALAAGPGRLTREGQGKEGHGDPGEKRRHGRNLRMMWERIGGLSRDRALRARIPGRASIPPHAVENPRRPTGIDLDHDGPCRRTADGRGQGRCRGGDRRGRVVAGAILEPPTGRGGREVLPGGETAAAVGARRCLACGRGRRAFRIVRRFGGVGRAAAGGCRGGAAGVDGGDARGQGCGDGGGFVAAAGGAGIADTRGQERGGDEHRGDGHATAGPRQARVRATRRRFPAGAVAGSAIRPTTVDRRAARRAAPPIRDRTGRDHGHRTPRLGTGCLPRRAAGSDEPGTAFRCLRSRLEWASPRSRGRPGDVQRHSTPTPAGRFGRRPGHRRFRPGAACGQCGSRARRPRTTVPPTGVTAARRR